MLIFEVEIVWVGCLILHSQREKRMVPLYIIIYMASYIERCVHINQDVSLKSGII